MPDAIKRQNGRCRPESAETVFLRKVLLNRMDAELQKQDGQVDGQTVEACLKLLYRLERKEEPACRKREILLQYRRIVKKLPGTRRFGAHSSPAARLAFAASFLLLVYNAFCALHCMGVLHFGMTGLCLWYGSR